VGHHIDTTRVLLGGLLAGVVINISEFVLNGVVLSGDIQASLGRLNLPPVGGNAMSIFILMGFVLGIVLVWLYAAIRPRFGAGPTTAMYAGVVVWFLAYVWGSVGYVVMGFFPPRVVVIGIVWGLFEIIIAAEAGGWIYREGPEARLTSPPMPA
jgi:hypothetical protein